jgi:hypothetical protein
MIDEGRELIDSLRKTDCNWVGVTAEAGAGHLGQLWNIKKTLEAAGKEIIWVELKLANSSNWAKLASESYNTMQNNPGLMKVIKRMLELPFWMRKIDEECRKLGQPDVLEEQVLKSTNFNKNKKNIFIATHAVGAQSVALLSRKLGWENLVLGEFIPDPWVIFELRMMAAIDAAALGHHLVVVHDKETAETYELLRKGRHVLPWGTVSPPEFMFEEQTEKKDYTRIPPHLGIEFAGNEIPNYDSKVLRFLETIKELVRGGKIRLTIHTMHHSRTQKKIDEWTVEANLVNSEYLHIIKASNFLEAVMSRHEYVVGRDKFGKPDVVVTKGGEVPVEDRGRMLIAGVYGVEHEIRNIEVAMKEKPGFVIDLTKLPEAMWWKVIEEQLDKMPDGEPECRSRALLALGELVKLI